MKDRDVGSLSGHGVDDMLTGAVEKTGVAGSGPPKCWQVKIVTDYGDDQDWTEVEANTLEDAARKVSDKWHGTGWAEAIITGDSDDRVPRYAGFGGDRCGVKHAPATSHITQRIAPLRWVTDEQ